jgi:hypothetical protein
VTVNAFGPDEIIDQAASGFLHNPSSHDAEEGKGVAEAIRNAMALLESIPRQAPTPGVESVA